MKASQIVVAFVAGLGLGLFYFGGLWLTVRELPTMRWPGLWLMASFVGRTVLSLVGFYLAMGGRWERLVACFLGFLLARTLVVRR
ncbi:MAG TPA: ATP synthase subunit I [Candidatus Tectomicrobia bacterium]|nr:ATP synthase subunit I [Candidatus Tectomicrobia bacterium]